MKKTTLIFIAIFINSILLNSCTKDGDTGPAGPTGSAGNANVKSQTITVNPSDWFATGTFGQQGYGYTAIKSASIINQGIVDNGAVIGYINIGPVDWVILPFTSTFVGYQVHYTFQYADGLVYLEVYNSSLTNSKPTVDRTFKFVAIAASGKIANPDIDFTNYLEVKNRFNLAD